MKNTYTTKEVTIQLEVPDGYEVVGFCEVLVEENDGWTN